VSTTVVPVEASYSGVDETAVGAAPYVDTNDGDTSYLVFDPSGSGGDTWRCRLPATNACQPVEGIETVVVSRRVAGTGTAEQSPTVALQRYNSTLGLFQFLTLPEDFHDHGLFTYSSESIVQTPQAFFGYDFGTITDELAAGNLYITLFRQFDGNDQVDIRVTYAALRVVCPGGVTRVRQRQIDNLRARQHESRQQTRRGRSYI